MSDRNTDFLNDLQEPTNIEETKDPIEISSNQRVLIDNNGGPISCELGNNLLKSN